MAEIKLERRRSVVTLYQGGYHARIDALEEEVDRLRESESVDKRHGTKSQAIVKAKERDDLVAEAEQSAIRVDVWAIDRRDWSKLADLHPPRDGERRDELYGVNMKTFPEALLVLSILAPGEGVTFEDRLKLGEERLAPFEAASQVQWTRLVNGSWDVNVGDDSLPKSSLVSSLRAASERASKSRNAGE